jgi:AcrR family transcriptional regulator
VATNDELVAHVGRLRSTSPDTWPTRDRILFEAARLIAAKGYHGASTRDITSAVGIRQPSLFNHFASKQEIVAELMRYEVSIPAERARAHALEDGSAALRLYRYMRWDFEWYARMPLDLRGMQEELLEEPGLEQHRADLKVWKRAIERIVRDGVDAGEFHAGTPALVPNVLTALSWEVVRVAMQSRDGRASAKLRAGSTAFVLRGLLVDPRRADRIIAEGTD